MWHCCSLVVVLMSWVMFVVHDRRVREYEICTGKPRVTGPSTCIPSLIQRILCLSYRIYGTRKPSARVIPATQRYGTPICSLDTSLCSGFCCTFSTKSVLTWVLANKYQIWFNLFLSILYWYFMCLMQSLFRRMRFLLVQRSRIIRAAWNCGFCFGSICYMRSSATQILSFASHAQGMTYQEFGFALHKSFYLHQAGIDILCHGAWIKGCRNLLFASLVLTPYHQK